MQVRDELRVLVEAEVSRAIENFKKLEGSIDNATGVADKLGDGLDGVGRSAGNSSAGIGELGKALGSLAEVAAAVKALSVIKDMGAFALKTADAFQTMKNQFGVLLGDMEAGAGLFNEIKAFNDKTPFDMSTLTQATNVLIAAKVPLQDLQAQLTKFGDLSQGNSQKMTSYVNAFSQAAAKGKADMQVLNTYIHQGVPILDALAKNFNTTTDEIVKMSSEGKIGFTDFSKALDDLTAAGGQFFGGMELQSKSLAAMQEGLSEAVNSLAASFGDMLLPAATAVLGALTEIANAINDSPIAKGIFAGALVAISGFLAAMAVKATIAFARQMALNFAVGAMNPAVMAATIAAAGLAAGLGVLAGGYVAATSAAQNAKRSQEDFELALRKAISSIDEWKTALRGLDQAGITEKAIEAGAAVGAYSASITVLRLEIGRLEEEERKYHDVGTDGLVAIINKKKEELDRMNQLLEAARGNINNAGQAVVEVKKEKPVIDGDKSAAIAAEEFRKRWAEEMRRFEGRDNPFIDIEIAWDEKKAEAVKNGAKDLLGQINEYYQAKWNETASGLKRQEEQLQRDLSGSKIKQLEFQMDEEMARIKKLEEARILSAEKTGEDTLKIKEEFLELEKRLVEKYAKEMDAARLDEARASLVDWQQELSDSLALALIDLEGFGKGAAIVLGDLADQFANLGISASMTGIEEFGKALGKGAEAGDAWKNALAAMSMEILNALPSLFLQAGLQLIATPGMWPMGLALIAAAGVTQFTKGYVNGVMEHEQEKAQANAHGGVYEEYGRAAQLFAAGGAFTNQIVNSPTYFRHGGGLGLMGEAGPEAIMPLKRMSNGDLGVTATSGGANVTVTIINNSGAEVRHEESEDGNGGKDITVIIGEVVNGHIASGKADRVLAGRYGIRAEGV